MYFNIFTESSFKGIYAAIKESYKDYSQVCRTVMLYSI